MPDASSASPHPHPHPHPRRLPTVRAGRACLSVLAVLGSLLLAPLSQAQTCGSGGGATVCLTSTGSADNIALNWTVSGTVSNVQVYRDTDSEAAGRTRLSTVSASTTRYTDAAAAAGTRYWYWIKFTANGASYNAGPANAVRTTATTGGMRDLTSTQLAAQMAPGWNLGNSLEAIGGETAWGNPKVTQALLTSVKAAGFKTVRIPVSWAQYADASDTISAAWMARVTEVVGYARNAGLYVIINVHWDGGWMQPTYARQAAVNARLTKFWTQIANNFKNHDDYLLFAGTNEVMVDGDYGTPTVEYYTVQNSFNQTFVNAVRATGGNNAKRHLVVQGFNTNIDHTVNFATLPNDSASRRLMMEVHYYDPYNFTLNASSNIWQWGSIATDASATETWANESYLDAQFQKMKARFIDPGTPVILGEYGAISRTNISGAERYRTYWVQSVTRSAKAKGLVPVYWDNGYTSNNSMGLFNRATGAVVYTDLVNTIVNASK
ncbi:glycoside hydrolase family 5 protein [Roseateles amylovorans]|uniref:Glycoside hydrolase family 5 protein n=1 Tax=Roseateles amylovorans TaxID=2978473 RepID=A0ABY6B7K1_9BURK|nr:glycoside hydrolase family 5 protein [Roseateles amylovorans]UXH79191.1 glycoside hydrolase family 5 protein [Roseateles amylovorans]